MFIFSLGRGRQVGKYGYLVDLEAINNMVQALIEELMRPPTEEELTQLQEGECRNERR